MIAILYASIGLAAGWGLVGAPGCVPWRAATSFASGKTKRSTRWGWKWLRVHDRGLTRTNVLCLCRALTVERRSNHSDRKQTRHACRPRGFDLDRHCRSPRSSLQTVASLGSKCLEQSNRQIDKYLPLSLRVSRFSGVLFIKRLRKMCRVVSLNLLRRPPALASSLLNGSRLGPANTGHVSLQHVRTKTFMRRKTNPVPPSVRASPWTFSSLQASTMVHLAIPLSQPSPSRIYSSFRRQPYSKYASG